MLLTIATLSKDRLHQEHIAQCAAGNGEQQVFPPQMKPGGEDDAQYLWQAVPTGKE